MNRAFTVAGVLALASASIWVGCGDSGGDGGSGGSGGSDTSSASSSKSATSTAKSTASVTASSSSSVSASSTGTAGCDAPAMPPSMGMCVTLTTGAGGGGGGGGGEPGIECNPVTNEPCDTAAGEACDFAGPNAFACYGGNEASLCEACDQENVFCFGTMTCDTEAGLCTKYCCSDGDCGTGTCQALGIAEAPMLGTCSLP